MALLSKEQYQVINEQRQSIEQYVNQKSCRNLPREWLHKAALINMSIYKAPYTDINCKQCIGQLLTRLYNPLVDYETEQKEIEKSKVLEAEVIVEIPEVKRKGRKPKDWAR